MTKIEHDDKTILIVQWGERTFKTDKPEYEHLFKYWFIK